MDSRFDRLTLGRAVVAAVRAVPGVSDMSPGRYGEVATYGAGEKVPGVLITMSGGALTIDVHVCAEYDHSLVFAELAARVRNSIRQTLESSNVAPMSPAQIDISFDDLHVPQDNG
jgi:uncharacterized alkaline shock family protein YloU